MEDNSNLKSAVLKVVKNPLGANEPSKTRQTLDRLISERYSEDDTMNLIGCVVIYEIFDIMKKQEPFNPERFAKSLKIETTFNL